MHVGKDGAQGMMEVAMTLFLVESFSSLDGKELFPDISHCLVTLQRKLCDWTVAVEGERYCSTPQ